MNEFSMDAVSEGVQVALKEEQARPNHTPELITLALDEIDQAMTALDSHNETDNDYYKSLECARDELLKARDSYNDFADVFHK